MGHMEPHKDFRMSARVSSPAVDRSLDDFAEETLSTDSRIATASGAFLSPPWAALDGAGGRAASSVEPPSLTLLSLRSMRLRGPRLACDLPAGPKRKKRRGEGRLATEWSAAPPTLERWCDLFGRGATLFIKSAVLWECNEWRRIHIGTCLA